MSQREVILELNFLQTMGAKMFLCPFVGRTKLQMFGYWTICTLVLCTAVQLCLTIYFIGIGDWLEIVNIAPNLGVVVIALLRYTKVESSKVVYDEILQHFYIDVWQIVITKTHNDIIERYKSVIKFFNRFLIYYSRILSILIISFPYLVMTYERKFNNSDEYLYPFNGWYPFDKIKWYWPIYVWETLMTIIVIRLYLFIILLHAVIIGFICMELKIIGNHIEKLIDSKQISNFERNRFLYYDKKIISILKSLISKHFFLVKASANVDTVLGDSMLINYSVGAVFICLTAFTSTVVDNFYQKLRYSSMCISLLLDILYFCIFGQIICDHSEKLTESVYSSAWPSSSAEVKKIMLMFMVRTQKPFRLSANGYFPMNMNTFSSICSSSYQMFNLIRTMYAKKNT